LTGDLVGTLRYMSPEQALGKRGLVDPRSDIYSLAVTLYELLTLRPAFAGEDRQELLRRIAQEEPPPPRRLNRAVPAELETIVLKAMAKEPAERYASAQELADDLRRWLDDRPIRARRPPLWQRLRKWLRRHRAVVTAACVAAVAGLTLTVAVLAASYVRIREEQKQTRDALQGMTQARQELGEALDRQRETSYYQSIAVAHTHWETGLVGRAEQLLDECSPGFRQWEWHYLKRLCHADRLTLHADSPAYSVAYSPDGGRLASGHVQVVRFWDVTTGREVRAIPAHALAVTGVAFSPDGAHLASAGSDKVVHLWDVATGHELVHLSGHADRVTSVAFSPDG
jgi:hypothetical protein